MLREYITQKLTPSTDTIKEYSEWCKDINLNCIDMTNAPRKFRYPRYICRTGVAVLCLLVLIPVITFGLIKNNRFSKYSYVITAPLTIVLGIIVIVPVFVLYNFGRAIAKLWTIKAFYEKIALHNLKK